MPTVFLLFHDVPLNDTRDLVGVFMCPDRVSPLDERRRFVAYAENLAAMCDWDKRDLFYTSTWKTTIETNGFNLKQLFPEV